jgi:hypothetical protein
MIFYKEGLENNQWGVALLKGGDLATFSLVGGSS